MATDYRKNIGKYFIGNGTPVTYKIKSLKDDGIYELELTASYDPQHIPMKFCRVDLFHKLFTDQSRIDSKKKKPKILPTQQIEERRIQIQCRKANYIRTAQPGNKF